MHGIGPKRDGIADARAILVCGETPNEPVNPILPAPILHDGGAYIHRDPRSADRATARVRTQHSVHGHGSQGIHRGDAMDARWDQCGPGGPLLPSDDVRA